MRLGMMVSLSMLGVAMAGCQSSHPTTKPSGSGGGGGGGDDCDCCKMAALAPAGAAAFAAADAHVKSSAELVKGIDAAIRARRVILLE